LLVCQTPRSANLAKELEQQAELLVLFISKTTINLAPADVRKEGAVLICQSLWEFSVRTATWLKKT
jgi:hypothetical protein